VEKLAGSWQECADWRGTILERERDSGLNWPLKFRSNVTFLKLHDVTNATESTWSSDTIINQKFRILNWVFRCRISTYWYKVENCLIELWYCHTASVFDGQIGTGRREKHNKPTFRWGKKIQFIRCQLLIIRRFTFLKQEYFQFSFILLQRLKVLVLYN